MASRCTAHALADVGGAAVLLPALRQSRWSPLWPVLRRGRRRHQWRCRAVVTIGIRRSFEGIRLVANSAPKSVVTPMAGFASWGRLRRPSPVQCGRRPATHVPIDLALTATPASLR